MLYKAQHVLDGTVSRYVEASCEYGVDGLRRKLSHDRQRYLSFGSTVFSPMLTLKTCYADFTNSTPVQSMRKSSGAAVRTVNFALYKLSVILIPLSSFLSPSTRSR